MRYRNIVTFALPLALAAGFCPAAAAADTPSAEEIGRRLDALGREVERLVLGERDDKDGAPRRGIGVTGGAAKVYGIERGVALGGYGEFQFEKPDREREDGTPSGQLPRFDVLRVVAYLGYRFNDELLFDSEIEYEHAGVFDEASVEVDTTSGEGEAALSGEVKIEFAWLDWSRSEGFGVRAGLVLAPVGFINEMHEPTTFWGTLRPEVERNIIPATWSGVGAGVYGALPAGFSYRTYVMEGLDAAGFTARGGIRGGRQGGSRSLATHPALTARTDWEGLDGLTLGASLFTGNSWQREQPGPEDLSPVVTLWDLHARFERRGFEARALWADGRLSDAADLSDALGLTGASRLGERFYGGYVEATFDVLPLLHPGTRYGFAPYARVEHYDTQEDVPGGIEDPAAERTLLTLGLAFKPHPNAVVKFDRQQRSNAADTAVPSWNLALGYAF